ncbi:hypothetical protein R1sor_012866 [Riccia sorocarpa]|uniref:RNA-binding protein 48 n=1 Tax=Riccia sorocarpa TaxID=122646 RepID=A0ABD3I506_9MARC
MQRPEYRTSRRERAVRVYTICDESRYLIVKNVPALGCIEELVKLFGLYGPIEEYRLLDEEDCEPFTDVYWIKYSKLCNATFAKRKLDEYKFLGNLLEVSYAPQYETLSDTKNKLEERRRMVLHRIRLNAGVQSQEQRNPAVKRSVSGLKDPLLQEDPAEDALYPSFPSESTQISSSQYRPEGLIGPLPESGVKDYGNIQYFPSSSMNSTVQKVRDTLSKIEKTGLSEKPPEAAGDVQVIMPVAMNERPAQAGNSEVVKKRRQDNRRRI